MGILGKYDFPGIRKAGTFAITTMLVGTPVGHILNVWGLGYVLQLFIEWGVVWFANKGLIIFNIGFATVENQLDQKAFDNAMEKALAEVELKAGKLTPEEIKAIDDKVIEAFLKFAQFSVPKRNDK